MTEQDDTRKRLVLAALEVFSEHGYHAATTREICRRANANLAAIHYHFGDKAELYRAVFRQPFLDQADGMAPANFAELGIEEALSLFYRVLLNPIFQDGSRMRQIMRLHAREEIDPSGVLGESVTQAIRPNFEQLVGLLCRELKVARPDHDIERLAFCLVGMARIFFHGECVVNAFCPELLSGKDAMETMVARLARYATSMISTETALRRN